jgi:DNA polymerase bacteriophage-type
VQALNRGDIDRAAMGGNVSRLCVHRGMQRDGRRVLMLAGSQYYAGIGVSTVLADIDFETFSEAGFRWDPALSKWKSLPGIAEQNRGLPVAGIRAYVEHPSFEGLCFSYDLKDGTGRHRWRPGLPEPTDLLDHIRAGKLLEAHNSAFEWQSWNWWAVPKMGWAPLKLEQMRCSMAKARAHALPGQLKLLGEVLDVEHKKIADGDRLIKKFTVPRNPTKKNPSLRLRLEDDPKDAEKFYAYNEGDIVTESECSIRIPDLSPFELDVWMMDQRINVRGVAVDMAAVENCIAIVEQAHEKYNFELYQLTGGTVTAASEVEELKRWLHGHGVHMPDMQEESVSAQLTQDMPANCRRALEIRAMLGSASVKKLFSIRAQRTTADRLHDLYSYYAGRTGRWTGNGPQPQNLYKGSFETIEEIELCLSRIASRCLELIEFYYGDALTAVNNCMRSLFVAGPGKDLISSDYTGIENVVAAGLAGEEWILEIYRTHGLVYEATASAITGIPFQEYIDYKARTGKHHPTRQTLGKPGALGSQFGGWIGAWKGFGADEYLTDQEMKDGILAWRAKSPHMVETWGGQSRDTFQWGKTPYKELFGLEGAAIAAVENPGQAFYGNADRTISLQTHGDCLYMKCPGGGLLTYHMPRLAPSSRLYAQPWEQELSFSGYNTNIKKGPKGWIRMKLYGGILFENAVQHVARHIMAGGMLRLEAAGYPIVLHTHDEPVSEIPEGFGSVEEFERIICDVGAEFAHLPIKAKGGWRGKRYCKLD